MEVHEYNPERRFVILTGSSSGSEGGETDRKSGPDRRSEPERRSEGHRRTESSKKTEPERKNEPAPKPARVERVERPERNERAERQDRPERTERFERQERPQRNERIERQDRPERNERAERAERQDRPERSERVERQERPLSEAYTDTRSSRRYDTNLKADAPAARERSRPPLEKRRSRQDLPRLETELRDDQLPEKYRTRPSAPPTSRYEQPPARPPKIPVDPLLAPEIIKSSASGRDQAYYGQSQSAARRSPTRPNNTSSIPSERRYEGGHTRNSSTASTTKRTTVEPEKSTRPLSKERVGETPTRPLSKERVDEKPTRPLSKERIGAEPPYRTEYASRSSRKENSPPYSRPERDDFARSSTYPSREPVRESTTRRDDRRDGRDDRGEDSRSGDDHPKGPRELHPRRKKSVVLQDDRDSQPKLEKVDAPSGPREKIRGPTIPIPVPIPIPNGSSASDDLPPSVRPASTFPITKDHHPLPERPKSELPYPMDDDPLVDPFDMRGNAERVGRSRSRYDGDSVVSMPSMPAPIPNGPGAPLETRPASAFPSTNRPPPSAQSWQPPAFDPVRDGVRLEKPVGSVRRHSEQQEATGVTTFPECRRKHPVAGLVDWLTLPRTDFNICPDCYSAVFAKTQYRNSFQPMLRPSSQAISCDFGVGPWYRIAWLLTLKNELPDLRLFHEVANVITASIFIPVDSRSEPTRGLCAMRFKPKRKRFVMYFDALETTSDQARREQEEPDVTALAQDVEKMAAVSECQEDKPIANGYWHIMQYLQQFTVCGECFDEVVRPSIKDDNVIARNFYMKPQKLPLATCQLYSNRMREIFKKACRWNDPKYLEAKVLERMDVEAMIHEKLAKLERSKHDDEDWVEEQVDKYIQEWKRWE
ncbi:hypothetical protein ACLX1H_006791 [Fusarium chlamydosporum]